jgi:LCP family protein required for cell wall assembly
MSDTRDGGIWQPHSGDEPRDPRGDRHSAGRASSHPTSPGRGVKRTATRGQRGYQEPIGPGDYPVERGDAEWPENAPSAGDAAGGDGLWTPGGDGPTPGDGRRGGPGGPRGKKLTAKQRRRRKILKWTGMSMALVLVAVAAFGGYWWWRLNHNIGVGNLHSAVGDIKTMAETKDAFGNSAMNILVIGTDARNNPADCKLGGDCSIGSTGGNADVEMIVHLSADRSNMEIISIPRDTYVNVPACKANSGGTINAYFGMVNSALQVNTGCQVDTVQQLTGLQIDHFIEVDFNGVVQMTNAVGGVQICVKTAITDSYSHLSLPAGTSTVQGTTALALLRSRHGFGDGSDLERQQVQHMYLSSLIRKIKANANFMNASNLLGIADTATKSVTVDPGLDGITNLISLGQDLNKVPTKRIEFLTMPTVPYGQHLQPNTTTDQQLFSLVNSDMSLTAGTAPKTTTVSTSKTTTAATTTAAPATEPASAVHSVMVENGTTTAGRAATIKSALQTDGVPTVSSGNYSSGTVGTTDVYYQAGYQQSADTVAALLGIPASHVMQGSSTNGYAVTLVLGSDFTTGTKYGASSPSSSSTTAALSSSLSSAAAASNASQSKCATGSGNGVDY